ncbi:MAG: helix-turn-helix transcriptional regulator, partial [Planctomycetes bacterium]|nr:helix-turn-helix transcriptional regulator [Planctomycetota bacterium]
KHERKPSIIVRKSYDYSQSQRIAQYLDDISDLYWSTKKERETAVRGLLLTVFSELLSMVDSAKPETGKKIGHPKVNRCKELVMSNLADSSLSVKQLAGWINCAPDYLSHLFSKETGLQLATYINQQRISFAKDLLGNPRLNITEVAWASGYADPGYFARIFKKLTGQTPMQYRGEIKGTF